MLSEHGSIQSMSKKDGRLDNEAAMSFFGHLKEEFTHRGEFASVGKFRAELDT